MKNILGWIKSNLLIVIPLLVAIIAAPVLIYFSSGWNAKIRKKATEDTVAAMKSLDVMVNYEVPATVPGVTPPSVRINPNPTATAAVGALWEQAKADSEATRLAMVEINRRGKPETMLIGGAGSAETLFPAAPNESERVRLLTKLPGDRQAAYETLLREAHAGSPPNAENIRARLQSMRDEEVQRLVSAREDQKLTLEEETQIRSRLTTERLEIYERAARELSFYASLDSFSPPVAAATRLPTIEQAWDWQHIYWIHSDIIAAMAKANTDPMGLWLPVTQAPVKRVVSLSVEPIFAPEEDGRPRPGSSGGNESAGGAAGPVPEDLTQPVARDYTLRHTGRNAWPGAPNGYFDIREAQLTIIADSAGLPAIVNAINSTNFMTVAGLSFEAHDPQAGIGEGYFYGPAHLVQARLTIETVWLRGWMKQFMPPTVRERFGIPPDPAPAPEGQPADDSSA